MNSIKYTVLPVIMLALVFSFSAPVLAQNVSDTNAVKPTTYAYTPHPTDAASCKKYDMDQNGVFNENDNETFRKLFAQGNMLADVYGDKILNVMDFNIFLNGFAHCSVANTKKVEANTTTKTNATVQNETNTKAQPVTPKNNTGAARRAMIERTFSEIAGMITKYKDLVVVMENRINVLDSMQPNIVEAKARLESAKRNIGYAENALESARNFYKNGNGPIIISANLAKEALEQTKDDLIAANRLLGINDEKPLASTKNTDACKKFDMNADGKLSSADHVAFQAAFAKADMRTDIDQNDTLDIKDFSAYINGFAGCTR